MQLRTTQPVALHPPTRAQPLSNAQLYDDNAVRRAVEAFRESRVGHASTVNVLSVALYSVFSTPPPTTEGGDDDGIREALRDACFQVRTLIFTVACELHTKYHNAFFNFLLLDRMGWAGLLMQYLSKGSFYAAGPIGLLAALTPRPSVLTTHFFLVAFYAVRLNLSPFPTLARLRKCYR
jgi:squalene monooxygenase